MKKEVIIGENAALKKRKKEDDSSKIKIENPDGELIKILKKLEGEEFLVTVPILKDEEK